MRWIVLFVLIVVVVFFVVFLVKGVVYWVGMLFCDVVFVFEMVVVLVGYVMEGLSEVEMWCEGWMLVFVVFEYF